MADKRPDKISGIACKLFINLGYSRTQIRDIAKAAGISVGAVYLLFTSKKAILDYIMKCDIDPSFREAQHRLPISEDDFPSLQTEVMAAFYKSGIRFAEPITLRAQEYLFEDMLMDAYEIVAQYGATSLILENNPTDYGKLGAFYVQYKQRFYETFLRFIRLNIESGKIRQLPYPESSTLLMLEMLYFWAARTVYTNDALAPDLPSPEREEICLDALLHAFQSG